VSALGDDSAPTQGGARLPGGLPWEPRVVDLGVRVVDRIGYSLTLDKEWSTRTERGFVWWGKDLAQRVWAEPGWDDNGFEIFRLHAQTDLLRDFEPGDENLAKLSLFARFATTSGYLVDPEDGSVRLAASMYVHEQTEDWVKATFQWVVAMQAADAQIKAATLADATDSTVAVTAHPVSGVRTSYDDMLNVLELVESRGREPSVWEGEEMEWTTGLVQQGNYTVLATGDSTGLSAEFPFQSRTSLLRVSTSESNPQVGNGALLILHLPMSMAEQEGVRFASELNRRELASETRAAFVGSWCWADDRACHVMFLPNAVRFGRGDLLNVVMSMTHRARWAAETFYGDRWDANRDAAGLPLATPSLFDLLPEARTGALPVAPEFAATPPMDDMQQLRAVFGDDAEAIYRGLVIASEDRGLSEALELVLEVRAAERRGIPQDGLERRIADAMHEPPSNGAHQETLSSPQPSPSTRPVFRTDKDWSVIDSDACRVKAFSPMATVEGGRVLAQTSTEPYASIVLECDGRPGEVVGLITHKIDFAHLWAAFKERGVREDEEVIVFWTKKNLKKSARLMSKFMPKLWVMICPKGAFELMTDANFMPELAGMARWEAQRPLIEWKPGAS
jgi:hypothetical protein